MGDDGGTATASGDSACWRQPSSGRALEVAAGEPGEPAWTDGRVVFVDPVASARDQVETLAVQASLLAAGSLDPDVVRRLTRRPALARRYLAVEGHRALAANEALLPRPVRSLIDCAIAARGDSRLHRSRSRGAARRSPTRRRASERSARDTFWRRTNVWTFRGRAERDAVLVELEPSEERRRRVTPKTRSRARSAAEARSVGCSSGCCAWGARSTAAVPRAPTLRRTARVPRREAPAIAVLAAGIAGAAEEAAAEGRGTKYPEWDVHRRCYRQEWCTVQEVELRPTDSTSLLVSDPYGLRRPLARLGMGLDRCHRQAQGDDIDIDAAVEARVELMARSMPDEAVYIDSIRRRRDLAVLLLLDVSGSAAEPGATGQTVHEQQRAAAAALTVALHDLGDRVALYAYHSRGRSAVQLVPVKLRRRSRHPRDAASPRPRARRLLEARCCNPPWRGGAGETGRDVAAVARRAVRWLGLRPRL